MSKLDRQLDQFAGGRVEIEIAAGEAVDVPKLHQLLRNEIDRRPERIPVDLRKVHGAPPELIDVLAEAFRYAQSQNKILSISYALPAMQEALSPRRYQTSKRAEGKKSDDAAEEPTDAGTIAKSILDTRLAEELTYDLSNAEPVARKETPPWKPNKAKRAKRWQRLLLVFAVVIATVVIGVVEWIIVFDDDSDAVIMPTKTFEATR